MWVIESANHCQCYRKPGVSKLNQWEAACYQHMVNFLPGYANCLIKGKHIPTILPEPSVDMGM